MAFNKSLAGYFDDLQHIGIPTDDLQKNGCLLGKARVQDAGQF